MVLNSTEFVLCHDLRLYVRWMEKYRPDVQGVWAYDVAVVDPLERRDDPVTAAPLYFQRRWGYHPVGERSRLLHRFPDARYNPGRHGTPLLNKVLDDGVFVAWFGWSPMRYVVGRKLQIQERVPPGDRAAGMGRQHIVTAAELEGRYHQEAARAYDLWERHPTYREVLAFLAGRAELAVEGLTLPRQ
jgi:hypothetical protein